MGNALQVKFQALLANVAGVPQTIATVGSAAANIGSPVTLLSSGQATLTTTVATGGSHAFTALYSGDANYNESVSSAVDVTAEDFSLSATVATIAQPGQSGTAAITVTGSANFTGAVNFTCALPNSLVEAACFVNPNTITGSGQVTLTVNTTPPHALVHPRLGIPPIRSAPGILLGSVTLLLLVLILGILNRQWRVPAVLSLGMLAIVLFATSCGGGSNSVSDPGTPTGTYNVVVTGTSGSGTTQIQHTAVVPLTVQ